MAFPWAAMAAIGTLGGLGLNYMGLNSASKAQKQANAIQQQELAYRRAMQQKYMENEMKRLEGDRGLQEDALSQIYKLIQDQQAEIAPIREDFYKKTDPYFEEQQLYLKDPVAWQKQQDKLMLNSPYAAQGAKGEGRAYMGAKANPYQPSSFFTDAAKQAWSDAIKGFSDDRTKRQKQALEAADVNYKNKVSDVGNKYAPNIDYIKDLLGVSLGNSEKMGEAGARSLGYGMESSREAAEIGKNIALGKGESDRAKYTYFGDILKDLIPERTVGGYSNADDYLTDKYMEKELGLGGDDLSILKSLRRIKKKNPTLLDIFNNADEGSRNV